MMSFCGVNSTAKSLLENRCFGDLIDIVINVMFVCMGSILMMWRKLKAGAVLDKLVKEHQQTPLRLRGHVVRWCLLMILVFANLCKISEVIWSEFYVGSIVDRHHVIVAPVVSLLTTAFILGFYHKIESWNCVAFLLLLLVYWPFAISVRIIQLISLQSLGLSYRHLRVVTVQVDIIAYGVLFLLEVVLVISEKYLCRTDHRKFVKVSHIAGLRYLHNYAMFLSKGTFSWIIPLLKLGFERPLELSDLGNLPEEELAEYQYKKFKRVFDAEKVRAKSIGRKLSLWRVYAKVFWPVMLVAGFFKFLADFSAFVGPLAIGVIIKYVEGNARSNVELYDGTYYMTVQHFFHNGYVISILVLFGTFLQSTSSQTFMHIVIMEGVHLRSAIQGLVYSKSLKITTGDTSVDTGSIVNHISNDAFNLLNFFSMGHYLWAIPVKVVTLLVLLYLYLGSSALIGAGTLIIIAPIQYYLVRKMKNLQDESFKVGDERLKKTNELLQGIKLLKLYGWEYTFFQFVQNCREKEIKVLKKDSICKALNTSLTQASSILVALVTFGVFSLIEGRPLTPSDVFTGLALFNQLTVPLFIFPIVIPIAVSAIISTRRLENFLSSTEVHSFFSNSHSKDDKESVEYQPEANGSIPMVEIKRGNMDDTVLTTMEAVTEENEDELDGVFLPDKSPAEDETDVFLPDDYNVTLTDSLSDITVSVRNSSFKWSSEDSSEVLRDITFDVPTGKLTMIVGSVGSGKTSLISALMGELQGCAGTVEWFTEKEVSYAPQKPWLINASLKENILFGKPFDHRRYQRVIQACALQPDIELLPGGDNTEIGEKGINLSGGQKQRIALARAFYTKARTVILDDPLSALDAQVGIHVFEQGIQRLLLKRKRTVLLVTHKLQYLPKAAMIVVLDKGQIKVKGTYGEIQGQDSALCAIWKAKIRMEEQENKLKSAGERTATERRTLFRMLSKQSLVKMQSTQDVRPPRIRLMSLSRQMSHDPSSPIPCQEFSEESEQRHHPLARHVSSKGVKLHNRPIFMREESTISTLSDDIWIEDDEETDGVLGGQLMTEEERQRGQISKRIYLTYMKACGYVVSSFLLFIMTVTQGVKVYTDFWLSEWSSKSINDSVVEESVNSSNRMRNLTYLNASAYEDEDDDSMLYYYLYGYTALSIASLIMYFITNLTWVYGSLQATRKLHSRMLFNLIHCPMRFFDTTPLGRIVNRFSSDISVVDKKLPVTLPMLIRFLLLCLSAIAVDTIVTPYFLLVVLPVIVIYYLVQKFFRSTSRELQRLDSITKSPIYSHFSETLGGLPVIRAYRDEERFTEKIMNQINVNNAAFILVNSANRWLAVTLDYLGGCILFIATVSAITAAKLGHVTPAFVGLAMTYTLLVPIYLNWVVRNLSEVEMHMNAVERIDNYSNLPEERYIPEKSVESMLKSSWPESGSIRFERVSLRYAVSLDRVLSNVSFEVHAGEKVGICGRTGSGKSSLTLGLFRMIDIAEGSIFVDDVDVTSVPLRMLRSRLSIIPQDAVLFSGTIRENIDPDSMHSDEELWEALKRSQLRETIAVLPGKLDAEVSEEGGNFSLGQRQLFCLCRAILRKSKILVMDEATASLDDNTDQIVQKVVASVFADCTVLTIAHRTSTILNYDKIIVLDSGEIAEYGTPTNLLLNSNGIFASLVQADRRKT
ncbi:Sur (predicted) [Pycnogonum litorale]